MRPVPPLAIPSVPVVSLDVSKFGISVASWVCAKGVLASLNLTSFPSQTVSSSLPKFLLNAVFLGANAGSLFGKVILLSTSGVKSAPSIFIFSITLIYRTTHTNHIGVFINRNIIPSN